MAAKRKPTHAEWCWVGLTAYVLAADVILMRGRKDTMSIQFGKWLTSPRGRIYAGAAWGLLTAHLFWSLPIPGQTKLRKFAEKDYRRNGNSRSNYICIPIRSVGDQPHPQP